MMTLQQKFEFQLRCLYNTEKQLIDFLPKMAKSTKDANLQQLFKGHILETKRHKKRIDSICKELHIKPSGEVCKTMKYLLKEVDTFLKEVIDANLFASISLTYAHQIEGYKVSAYKIAIHYAEALGYIDLAKRLQATFDEENTIDDKLKTFKIESVITK